MVCVHGTSWAVEHHSLPRQRALGEVPTLAGLLTPISPVSMATKITPPIPWERQSFIEWYHMPHLNVLAL